MPCRPWLENAMLSADTKTKTCWQNSIEYFASCTYRILAANHLDAVISVHVWAELQSDRDESLSYKAIGSSPPERGSSLLTCMEDRQLSEVLNWLRFWTRRNTVEFWWYQVLKSDQLRYKPLQALGFRWSMTNRLCTLAALTRVVSWLLWSRGPKPTKTYKITDARPE